MHPRCTQGAKARGQSPIDEPKVREPPLHPLVAALTCDAFLNGLGLFWMIFYCQKEVKTPSQLLHKEGVSAG